MMRARFELAPLTRLEHMAGIDSGKINILSLAP